MFKDKLPGARFFARIGRELDLECPRCGLVYSGRLNKAVKSTYGVNPRTQRYQCTNCDLVLGLGLLAWPLVNRGSGNIPIDAIPTVREALQMRQQAGGLWLPEEDRQPGKAPRNVVLVGGCTCTESSTGIWVNPGCPVHGHGEVR